MGGHAATGLHPRSISTKLAALGRLAHEQRAHYDMKHGFPGSNGWSVVPAEQVDLFRTVARVDLNELAGGFGRKILNCLSSACSHLVPADLARAGCATELDQLLHAVEERL